MGSKLQSFQFVGLHFVDLNEWLTRVTLVEVEEIVVLSGKVFAKVFTHAEEGAVEKSDLEMLCWTEPQSTVWKG